MQQKARQYVLRIPRADDTDISYEVAMFRYVAQHTSLPVPEVLRFDLTKDNPIGHFYSIQQRIPGSNLCELWKTLNHQQKISAAKEWARVLREMQEIRKPYAGFVSPKSIQDGTDGESQLVLQIFTPHGPDVPCTPRICSGVLSGHGDAYAHA